MPRWTLVALSLAVIVAFVALAPSGTVATSSVPGIWAVLVRVISVLPIGELAWRVHVLSAVAAGIAVWLLAQLIIDAGRQDVASWVGAVGAASILATVAPWALAIESQGPIALAMVCVLAALRGLHQVARGDGAAIGLSSALWLGVAVALDLQLWPIALPAFALVMIRLRHGARWPLLMPVISVLGFLGARAAQPLRAAAHAPWRIWFASWTAAAPRELGSPPLLTNISSDRFWFDALGPVVAVAAVIGIILLIESATKRWLAAMVGAVVVAGVLAELSRPGTGAPWIALAAAICAGFALARWSRTVGSSVGQACVGIAAVAIAVVSAGAVSLPALLDERAMGDRVIAVAPPSH